jgi:polysaccharide biosynthesis transport protein
MSRNFELLQNLVERTPTTIMPPEVRRPASALPGGMAPEPESSAWHLAIEILRKRWLLSAVFALVVLVSVTVVILLMKPVYEPEARVQVDPPGGEIFALSGNNNNGTASDYLETQAQNLQSDELGLEVIRSLGLEKKSDFASRDEIASNRAGISNQNSLRLTPAENQALLVFKANRKVTRDSASRLISVSVSAHDPAVAASVTNELVDRFIERDYRLRNEAISQSSHWLQQQLEDIRERMDDSSRALTNFQKASGIGTVGDNQNSFSEQMIEMSRQLTQAQADRIQLQSYLHDVGGNPSSSLPQINSNPVVQELSKKLADVQSQIAQSRAIYGENHPNIKKLRNESEELRSQLSSQRAALLNDLKTSYSAAQARERLMGSQLRGANKQMLLMGEYEALKRTADANTQLYNQLYQKIKEAAINAETKSSNIRVIDRARILSQPTRPNKKRSIAFGLLAGLLGGVILAFLREGLDTHIRTPRDIMTCLGREQVSVVPIIGRGFQSRSALKLLGSRASQFSNTFVIDQPRSPEAEALRGIYTSMHLSCQSGRAPQVLLIASPLPGEGKTLLAVNLALALAQHGSTCVMDADLRKQGVASVLGVTPEFGLTEVLSGMLPLEQAIVPTPRMSSLYVLGTGAAPAEPGTLIASSSMNSLLQELRQRFDFVVIDSPPILPFADGRFLSALVDGIVMVGRSGMTTRENLKRAMELLRKVRSAPVVELVLNAADSPVVDYRYYRY